MNQTATNRVQSLDLLKGLVMVIMALDHVRDYFHESAFLFDPTDPLQTHLPLYLTRWITHFCAPAFSLLAGISAYLVGTRKTTNELSAFLIKRGLWLILIEVTVMTFAWYFDVHFHLINLIVIWSLGISMVILAGLVHFSLRNVLAFSLITIFGHNLLDYFHFDNNILWALLHTPGVFHLSEGTGLFIFYPILPWAGVMALGYYFGSLYNKKYDPQKRHKLLSRIGYSAIALFIIVRLINQYGNSNHWQSFETAGQTLFSFFNPSKYPPSLTYLLMTLGPTFLFLAKADSIKGKVVEFFSVYGRVPFFYYIIHVYVIHLLALAVAQFTGFGWQNMIFTSWVTESPQLKGYGLNLGLVYIIWIAIVILLYPLCKKFGAYKLGHKEQWWLSYF